MVKSNFKLTIEYDGTDFCGWQIQKSGLRTVQGEIKKASEVIFKQPLVVIASGRTDSGVHARGQVINFKAETRMKPAAILKALNSRLPADIAVLNVKEVDDDFHAQYSVKQKTYRYIILNSSHREVFERGYSYFFPYPLDIRKMCKAAKVLVGRHDFKAFQAHDPLRVDKDPIRTIKKLAIKRDNHTVFIDITADGFLYKMVRNITGTLLAIGSGQVPVQAMSMILRSKDRSKASATAPSNGLYLIKVYY